MSLPMFKIYFVFGFTIKSTQKTARKQKHLPMNSDMFKTVLLNATPAAVWLFIYETKPCYRNSSRIDCGLNALNSFCIVFICNRTSTDIRFWVKTYRLNSHCYLHACACKCHTFKSKTATNIQHVEKLTRNWLYTVKCELTFVALNCSTLLFSSWHRNWVRVRIRVCVCVVQF